jgi:hypothetical protein
MADVKFRRFSRNFSFHFFAWDSYHMNSRKKSAAVEWMEKSARNLSDIDK